MSPALTKEEAFARLGAITREMHEAIAVLGAPQLSNVLQEIPDARDRLTHVGKMTEEAANKVLNLVDAAKPECDDLSSRGLELSESLARMAAAEDLTLERAKALLLVCSKFAARSAQFSQGQAATLTDIMMSQDFQDLSGQIIQRVINIITRTELQLVQLLMECSPQALEARAQAADSPPAPADSASPVDNHTLQGPQIDGQALKQDDVDDLLASLGF